MRLLTEGHLDMQFSVGKNLPLLKSGSESETLETSGAQPQKHHQVQF
jgi:hypothetical protein